MKAPEFNALYDAAVAAPLIARGFVRRRQSLFYEADNAVLALLARPQLKRDSLGGRRRGIHTLRGTSIQWPSLLT